MADFAITVLGQDRPGIIAGVTAALAELGGNLEDSSMTLLRGHFAWTLVVELDVPPEAVAARLRPLTDDGLLISILPVPLPAGAPTAAAGYLLSVHGADRPGIVSAITDAVAAVGGNVTDLTTRLSGPLYVLVAEVALPAAADVEALDAGLHTIAARLGVDVSLRPLESDVL